MRIRSTQPEFWRSEAIADLSWEVHYDGPFPTGNKPFTGLAPTGPWEYVYLLFDEDDALLYVGRSFRPVDRFTKHRRKPWWTEVQGLVILRVHELPRWQRRWANCGPNTDLLERAAIAALHPTHNIAGVSA